MAEARTTARYLAPARLRGPVPFLVLAATAFLCTLAWVKGTHPQAAVAAGEVSRVVAAAASIPRAGEPSAQAAAAPDGQPTAPVVEPLPAEYLAELTAAGIGADDSEQRSLAIAQLEHAPVEQSLPAFIRILVENRDTRSRITAVEALARLPDSALVRASRQPLLARLSHDPDSYVAAAARRVATD